MGVEDAAATSARIAKSRGSQGSSYHLRPYGVIASAYCRAVLRSKRALASTARRRPSPTTSNAASMRRRSAERVDVGPVFVEQSSCGRFLKAQQNPFAQDATLPIPAIRVEPKTHDGPATPNDVGNDRHDRCSHLRKIDHGIPDGHCHRDGLFQDAEDVHLNYSVTVNSRLSICFPAPSIS